MTSLETSGNVTSCLDNYGSLRDCFIQASNGLRNNVEYGVTLLVMTALIILAIVDNTCVVYVITRTPHLRRQLSYVFVLNLCVTDILASVVATPFMTISYAFAGWPFEEDFCQAHGFLVSFCIIISSISISTISVDRLYSIKSPMHYAANMTLTRVMCIIAGIWACAFFIATLPLLGWNSYSFQEAKMYCFVSLSTGSGHLSYILLFSAFGFIIPGVVVIIMYICIYGVARKTATQVHPMPSPGAILPLQSEDSTSCQTDKTKSSSLSSQGQPETGPIFKPNITVNGNIQPQMNPPHIQAIPHQKPPDMCSDKSNKAAKILVLVILTFMVPWMPFFVFNIHCALDQGIDCSSKADFWTSVLGFASFAVNPIIYGILNRSVREEAIERFKQAKYCCRHNPDNEEGPGNEDFFEFLERTSVAQTSRNVESTHRSKMQLTKIAVVCGATNKSDSKLHPVPVNSLCSSIC